MKQYLNNEERTAQYHEQFNREKTLRLLVTEARPVVFDVGANIGATLEEFIQWWPDAVVHCFEPQKECWEELERRAGQFPDGQVIINQYAAGNAPQAEAVFYSHDITTGQSGFHRINSKSIDSIALSEAKRAGVEEVTRYQQALNHERVVRVVRLDEYMEETQTERINLLKIDTQGFEPEVLEGLGDRLRDVDVVLAELMFYDYYERSLSFTDVERWLLPAGLRLYDINHISRNPMNGRTDWVDVIYVNDRIRLGG